MFIFMELISSLGTKRTQGLVKGVDKSAVKISIDFKHSWETKVEVGGVQLLNLLVMQDGDDKNAYLDILKSNEAETNVSDVPEITIQIFFSRTLRTPNTT
jgi:hypothetical protein